MILKIVHSFAIIIIYELALAQFISDFHVNVILEILHSFVFIILYELAKTNRDFV